MIGALIGAGASLLGGLMGKKSAEKQAAQNIKMQKEFAQTGIQWKVKDAEKAGIHPLYALGAQTHSFSPVSVGDPLPGAIADMGQGIGRAVESGMSSAGRASRALEALTIQRAELENTKLASEIALMNQAGQPPAPITENAVIAGQAQSVVTAAPQETIINPSAPHQENVARPELMWSRGPGGGYIAGPSKETAESMESNPLGTVQFAIRNGLIPLFTQSQNRAPPQSWLPAGKGYNSWRYDAVTGEWHPFRSEHYKPIRSKGTIR